MPIIAALGAFSTVTGFVSTVSNALEADNPADFAKAMLGLGNGRQDQLVQMQRALSAEIDRGMDLDGLMTLNGVVSECRVILEQVAASQGTPDLVNAQDLIAHSKTALSDLKTVVVETFLDERLTPENVAATVAAVSTALSTRIAVIKSVEDGVFVSYDGEMEDDIAWGIDFLENANETLRESFDIEVIDRRYVDHVASLEVTEYEIDSATVPVTQLEYIWNTAEHHIKDIFGNDHLILQYGQNGDNLIQYWEKIGLPWEQPFDGSKTKEFQHPFDGDEFTLDEFRAEIGAGRMPWKTMGAHYQTHDVLKNPGRFAEWLEEALEQALFADAGLGPDGETLADLAEPFQDLTGGRYEIGTDGADVFDWRGSRGEGNDFINAKEGDDILAGGAGNDVLRGESGADLLIGGPGNDVLYGGTTNARDPFGEPDASPDRFVLEDTASIDTIVNFAVDEDRIVLVAEGFAALGESLEADEFHNGPRGGAGGAKLILDGAGLHYDADGAGGAAPVRFATLRDVPAGIDADDFEIVARADLEAEIGGEGNGDGDGLFDLDWLDLDWLDDLMDGGLPGLPGLPFGARSTMAMESEIDFG